MTTLEIKIGGVQYHPEIYNRESRLHEPGATWRAVVESCDKALWSSVVIKEDGTTVLTGYLLKREDERGRCHVSGTDTFIKVRETWITDDVETEVGQTVAYWIDTLMGYIDLEYAYPISVETQYVEPGVSIGPMSLYDALELVIRFTGLRTYVDSVGKVHFVYLIDTSRWIVPTSYLEREKIESDENARHQVSVFGMGLIKHIAVGESLGDPVTRIAVIDSPFLVSIAAALETAENALAAWNKYDDVRTIELVGAYPEYQLGDYVTENG